MNPTDVTRFKTILDKLQGKIKKGDHEYMSLCPGHDDTSVSLFSKLKDDGRIQLFCHSGCTQYKILDAMKLSHSILYPVAQITDLFDYVNIIGEFKFQEVKYDPSAQYRFKVRRHKLKVKEGEDKWIWDVKDTERILYNEFEVSKATDGDIIFMCEGSKDARTLLRLGLISTAALFNDWEKTNTILLDGKKVIILQDNDDAGKLKALKAAHNRRQKSKFVGILLLPELENGGDVTDWLKDKNTAHNKENLIVLANNVKEWYPQESIRQQIENKESTGLCFEHHFPRPIFLQWVEIYHPPEEGILIVHDSIWLKENPELIIYAETSTNELLESIEQLLLYCDNAASKKSDEPFKPTPAIRKIILEDGETLCDINHILHPNFPIFIQLQRKKDNG